jgi:competence protein ComGC
VECVFFTAIMSVEIFVIVNNVCKKTNVLGKKGSRECSKGNKTVPGKVATTRTEDGHKQDT